MNYLQKLDDPRWQRKRLEIMQRDNFECCACHNTGEKLVVHHLYYIANLQPWDYDNDGLVTLCHSCHNIIHKELSKLSGIIAFELITSKRSAI